jgi:hypothetical protein
VFGADRIRRLETQIQYINFTEACVSAEAARTDPDVTDIPLFGLPSPKLARIAFCLRGFVCDGDGVEVAPPMHVVLVVATAFVDAAPAGLRAAQQALASALPATAMPHITDCTETELEALGPYRYFVRGSPSDPDLNPFRVSFRRPSSYDVD